ncbi:MULTISPECIES: histidinol-phosphate transaminase [Methylophaga]|jgi:histidinol-phosphate aminotransferase|uniref:Histidinol-phosphate aminotransferase n=1 Tax=Methylophaga aminisulfidivorans MP TaxID=1026882 RepID=F5T147_9GAMM|nr:MULTISPECIES: histidinol-phosphate transaminase [Methylophaga]EGL53729.1 histidinol-phosphate/aromatic aminotransferase and cobyric acid decarboxylase [Methylophaga aminisulfidivorans MP]WVI85118.1 histidinol-phosphate transaminase [Methylophaga thalassica]
MSRFWSGFVNELDPYVPGEQPKLANLTKLNTNENPYGPSPKVIEAIRMAASDRLRLYPDPTSAELRQAIADFYRIDAAWVFVGNGSDEVLGHVFNAFFRQEAPILFPDISYSFYPVYCQLYQISYDTVPLSHDFSINVDDYDRINGGIIFPNPNAPTGCLLALSEIERLLQNNTESVVVIDEAYIDFGGESAVSLVKDYPNLLIVQTMSKSRSLAGMRVGYAIGQADLIEGLIRVKDSFNSYPVDSLASAAGVAAMNDKAYFNETCQAVIDERNKVVAGLEELGFDVLPSAANFVFASHKQVDAVEIAAGLRKEGIIVRHFTKPRINQFLRISIGTAGENQQLLSVLDTLV